MSQPQLNSNIQRQTDGFDMSVTGLRTLASHVSGAADQCRAAFERDAAVHIILEKVWALQDWLGRFVDAASDEPAEAAELLLSSRPNLVSEILESVDQEPSPSYRIAGVARSRAAIRTLASELDTMVHPMRMTAFAGN